MKQFLVIQTAFLGDAVLVTSIVEKLHAWHPDAQIDLVVRKGNELLFAKGQVVGGTLERAAGEMADGTYVPGFHEHPFLRRIFIWDKRQGKTRSLFRLIGELRKTRYDHIFNAQRFFSSGLVMLLAHGNEKVGYDKNPLSFLFSRKVKHVIPDPKEMRGRAPSPDDPLHEVDRLNALIAHLTDATRPLPKLYPFAGARELAEHVVYKYTEDEGRYVCIAPSSVWHTKQWPEQKWVELVRSLPPELHVFYIGAPTPNDYSLCKRIADASGRGEVVIEELLSPLASAALMQGAAMNYVNDSAPLHIASAMNAPVTAVFCSTVPAFGFGPLRANGRIVETTEKLDCRPCGLHGYRACPEGHFRCALGIDVRTVLT